MAVSLTFVFRVAFPYRLERQRHYCGGGGGGTGKKLDRSALLRGDHCGYWTVLNPDGPATNAEFPTAVLVQARERRPNNSRYHRRQHGTPVQNTLTTTSWRGRARGRSLTLSHPPPHHSTPTTFFLTLFVPPPSPRPSPFAERPGRCTTLVLLCTPAPVRRCRARVRVPTASGKRNCSASTFLGRPSRDSTKSDARTVEKLCYNDNILSLHFFFLNKKDAALSTSR